MIRVVQVLEATTGGTRRHLRQLVSALATDDFDVRIVCSTRRDPAFLADVDFYRRLGCPVEILDMVRRPSPLRDAAACRQLRNLLLRWHPDVVHLHSAKAGWIGRFATRGLRCQTVYSPHAFPFLRKGNPLARRVFQLAERLAARWTDVMIAVAPSERDIAIDQGLFHPNQIRVVPNAVRVEEQNHHRAPRVRSPPGKRVFGFIGELRLQKGPDLFLDAVEKLKKTGYEGRFLMPAWGTALPRIKRRIQTAELGDQVELVPVDGSFDRVLRKADISVLPSFWEGLPYALLESLAVERPVIASDLPPFRDVLQPLGPESRFPAGDAECLVNRIRHWAAISPSDLDRKCERCRALITSGYRLDAWSRRMRDLYSSLVEPSR